MKLKTSPENVFEWLALRLNLVPLPLLHGQMFPVIAKAVLLAADKGVFHAVEAGLESAEAVAATCGLQVAPARQLLNVLASSGYLSCKNHRYRLSPMARKWVGSKSRSDLSDLLVYNNRVVWKWMEHLETYLETGSGVDYHKSFNKEEWDLYQNAMRAVARSEVEEFARKCPVPEKARLMLDIGGAHGLHVKALRARYPALEAHILDLPGALDVQEEPGEDSITTIQGNILETDLVPESYDLILMSSLAHHFSWEENRFIARKAADALKPGGVYVINEFVNPEHADRKSGLVGTSSNLFFGLTSTSGTWTIAETQDWQKEAGLKPLKPIGYAAIPGRFQIPARIASAKNPG
ncbi:MAG: hypothetical protein ABS46_02630 [Cytophagaceae bacterium SCN 52-12]|nr:MAG: hypothetical protein ABS46_02630 [Cytophagaceae bacterium SCN 52-12]